MGQTVYVDLFFMINFSMDFLCLFLTYRLFSEKVLLIRALSAAILGGIYANVALFLPLSGVWAIAVDLLACALMCGIAFRGRFLAHSSVFVIICAVLGGFMSALFSLFNKMDLPLPQEEDGLSAWMLALLAALSAVIAVSGGRFFKRRCARRRVGLTLELDGRKQTIDAFCDSGNLLREPISGKPCILADAEALREILPREAVSIVHKKADISCASPELSRRLRLVPTRTATGQDMLVALRADKIILSDAGEQKEVDAFVALCRLGEGAQGCAALVPSEIIT